MRIIITGGTGLIGKSLIRTLTQSPNHFEIFVLSRDADEAMRTFALHGWTAVQVVGWDAQTAAGWGQLITADCAIVNLAGASPAHWRWTAAYKKCILTSRLNAGRAIMQAVEQYGMPAVLLQASASGYYGDRGEEILD